jgi:hypothetical protein
MVFNLSTCIQNSFVLFFFLTEMKKKNGLHKDVIFLILILIL